MKGFASQDAPCLAICYENGRVQISRSENDPHPVLIDTLCRIVKAQWNDT